MPEPLEAAARISIPDANQKAFDGSVLFVDVRNADAYKEKHIDGAINIPLEQIKTRAGELPRDKYLVTYCT